MVKRQPTLKQGNLNFNSFSHVNTCHRSPPWNLAFAKLFEPAQTFRQGYAFIEFRQESVAKIVAQTMNKILVT